MNERGLRDLIDRVKAGGMSRRTFVKRLTAVGLTAPLATQLLALSGVAMAQSAPVYKPTKRGGGGLLKVIWWQGPTLLNPHFAVGTKDQDACRLFYEPLAAWDPAGGDKPKLLWHRDSPLRCLALAARRSRETRRIGGSRSAGCVGTKRYRTRPG